MPISLKCETCGVTLQAPPHLAGEPVECPNCHRVVVVPGPDKPEKEAEAAPAVVEIAAVRMACSTCRVRLEVPAELRGQPVECPSCGAVLTVPSEEEEAAWNAEVEGKGPTRRLTMAHRPRHMHHGGAPRHRPVPRHTASSETMATFLGFAIFVVVGVAAWFHFTPRNEFPWTLFQVGGEDRGREPIQEDNPGFGNDR